MSIRITAGQARALGLPQPKRAKARERRPKPPGPMPEPPRRLLSLDPSSTAVGWALFDDGKLVSVGVCRAASDDVDRRIAKLMAESVGLVVGWQPTVVAMEVVSGMHRRANRSSAYRQSTATCGFAQGAIYGVLLGKNYQVCRIKENAWTGGTPKKKRAYLVRLTQPVYAEFARKDGDAGLDGADAVGLGEFFLSGRHQH